MKMKKKFNQHKRAIIQFYNYNIKCYGNFQNFEKRLERKEKKGQKLKLRHLRYQKKQIIVQNSNSKILYFPQLEKVFLWDSKSLVKLPRLSELDPILYSSYLHVPPL